MGYSTSIPKSWYQLKIIGERDLTHCYYKHYYCRSKKRIYRIDNDGLRWRIKPSYRDGDFIYGIQIGTGRYESISIHRDKLIDILKTKLKGESYFVDLDDLDDVELDKK